MIQRIQQTIARYAAVEDGQALVEYALIIGLVTIVALGSLTAIGTNVSAVLDLVADGFNGV